MNVYKELLDNKNTLDKRGNLRIDYLFSYWIFFWFIIYIINSNKYSIPSPIIALYFGLIENIMEFIMMYSSIDNIIKIKYVLMILTVKLYPIYLLRKSKVNMVRDILAFILLFIMYNIWLKINDTTIEEVYKKTLYNIKSGENRTPFFIFIESVWIELISRKI